MESAPERSRQAVYLNLTPRAGRLVAEVRRETGITQVAFLEKLLEWYSAQDPRVRTMILSPYPEVRQGLAKMVLDAMVHDTASDPEPEFSGLIDHDFGRPGTAAESAQTVSKPHRRRKSNPAN